METFKVIKKVLKPSGIYVLVVGTNRTKLGGRQFIINTPNFLSELANHTGWSTLEMLPLETYKRYGIHVANSVQDETLIVLKNEL
jgi:site-specific DNA-methyltransferase (cytosine-N4-specific)